MTENNEIIEEINRLRNRITELESHQHHHNISNEPAECEICHKVFRNKYILKTHKETMHNEER